MAAVMAWTEPGPGRGDPHRIAGAAGQQLGIAPKGVVLTREPYIGGPPQFTGMRCSGVDLGALQAAGGPTGCIRSMTSLRLEAHYAMASGASRLVAVAR